MGYQGKGAFRAWLSDLGEKHWLPGSWWHPVGTAAKLTPGHRCSASTNPRSPRVLSSRTLEGGSCDGPGNERHGSQGLAKGQPDDLQRLDSPAASPLVNSRLAFCLFTKVRPGEFLDERSGGKLEGLPFDPIPRSWRKMSFEISSLWINQDVNFDTVCS